MCQRSQVLAWRFAHAEYVQLAKRAALPILFHLDDIDRFRFILL
jgi:hypothetical protein